MPSDCQSSTAKFSAATYQDLWSRMRPLLGVGTEEYERYLTARYF